MQPDGAVPVGAARDAPAPAEAGDPVRARLDEVELEFRAQSTPWPTAGWRRPIWTGPAVIDHEFLDSFSLGIDGKAARYARLLCDLPPGLSEWAVHPGLGSDESRAIDPGGWRVRRTDYEFLTSPEARGILQQEGIVVIDYRTIQQAWSQARAPR